MTMCCLNVFKVGASLRHEAACSFLGVPLFVERALVTCRHPWGILACLWQTRSGCLLVLADHEPALSAWAAVCMRASKLLAALPQILSGSAGSGEACSCCRALGLLGRQHTGGELLSAAGTCLCYKSAVPSFVALPSAVGLYLCYRLAAPKAQPWSTAGV